MPANQRGVGRRKRRAVELDLGGEKQGAFRAGDDESAAGLGLNAFVAFTLVAGEGLSYPEAMGVIVVEGLVITLLVLTGLRNAIVDAIPMDLKRSIAIGIGLFLAVIGLVNAGVVVRGEGTVVAMSGNLTTLRILTFAIGLALCSSLVVRQVRGGLLIGIVATTVIAAIINAIWGHNAIWDALGPGDRAGAGFRHVHARLQPRRRVLVRVLLDDGRG